MSRWVWRVCGVAWFKSYSTCETKFIFRYSPFMSKYGNIDRLNFIRNWYQITSTHFPFRFICSNEDFSVIQNYLGFCMDFMPDRRINENIAHRNKAAPSAVFWIAYYRAARKRHKQKLSMALLCCAFWFPSVFLALCSWIIIHFTHTQSSIRCRSNMPWDRILLLPPYFDHHSRQNIKINSTHYMICKIQMVKRVHFQFISYF